MARLAADGQPGRKYAALLLPSKDTEDNGADDKVHGEGRYRWAREFALETQEFGDSNKSYVLALSDQGARYVPIESNMVLSKRKRDELANIEPPEHVRFLVDGPFTSAPFAHFSYLTGDCVFRWMCSIVSCPLRSRQDTSKELELSMDLICMTSRRPLLGRK